MTDYKRHCLRIAVLLATLAGLHTLHAQPSAPADTSEPRRLEKVTFRTGVHAAYGLNFHKTTSSIFSGGASCGAFGNGDGTGYLLGAFFEVPLLEKMLDLYGGLNISQRGGAFGEVVTGGLPILDPNTDEYTTLERLHSYNADLAYLQTEFGVRFTLPWFPLYVRGGAAIGFPMTSTFEQKEEITAPAGVVYPETNRAERPVASGDIREVENLVSAAGTLGYDIPLSTRLSIAPEITYYHPFNDVTLNRDWKIATLQGGAALRWHFGPLEKNPVIDPPPLPPGEPDQPPSLLPPIATLHVTAPKELSIVKTIVTETFPILPYIFFDSGRAAIPSRYNALRPSAAREFSEDDISWRSLEAYYNLLNIIGRRMTADESIRITVNGTTDGKEAGTREASARLAQGRSGAVKDYLVKTWGIDPDRIAVSTSPRPEYPSSEEYREGFEENRRVEIRSNNPNTLRPIVHERFNEYSYNPDQIRLNLGADASDGVASWRLNVTAGAQPAMMRGGEGDPPATLGIGIDQESAEKIAAGLSGHGALDAELTIRGHNNMTATKKASIPTTVEQNPFEVSRLSLIVFDFDKSEITTGNQAMVKAFVADALKEGSTMTIVGSTDQLGDTTHNKALSLARAQTVRGLILKDSPGAVITSVEGVGPRLRYDNSTPEGRYYCRSVTVEVKTPIGQTGG